MLLEHPLAFHITFGTYGMRLHGDPRKTVDRNHNQFGEPFIPRDDQWRREEMARLRFAPVELTYAQRLFVEATLPAVCERGGWTYHIAACQSDHVHVLISTDQESKAVRNWLKRWLGESLTTHSGTQPPRPWWAEGGSIKWVWNQEYLVTAYEYIDRQRTTGLSEPGSTRSGSD